MGSQVCSLNIRTMVPAWQHTALGHFTPGVRKDFNNWLVLTTVLFAGWDRGNSIQVLGSCNQWGGSAQVA